MTTATLLRRNLLFQIKSKAAFCCSQHGVWADPDLSCIYQIFKNREAKIKIWNCEFKRTEFRQSGNRTANYNQISSGWEEKQYDDKRTDFIDQAGRYNEEKSRICREASAQVCDERTRENPRPGGCVRTKQQQEMIDRALYRWAAWFAGWIDLTGRTLKESGMCYRIDETTGWNGG